MDKLYAKREFTGEWTAEFYTIRSEATDYIDGYVVIHSFGHKQALTWFGARIQDEKTLRVWYTLAAEAAKKK